MIKVMYMKYTTTRDDEKVMTDRYASRDAETGKNNNTTERQSNTTQLTENSHFSKKMNCLRYMYSTHCSTCTVLTAVRVQYLLQYVYSTYCSTCTVLTTVHVQYLL